MTSREIIIELINKQIIDGEQAVTLINDLLKAEMLEAWETLNASKQSDKLNVSDINKIWVNTSPYTSTASTYTTALTSSLGTNINNV